MQKTLGFEQTRITAAQTDSPKGYTGLYGFHKYWGKKPHEAIAYAIEQLTAPGDLVVDPFLGSGSAARESVIRGRRFIGFDINPIAVELARFITNPSDMAAVSDAFRFIGSQAKSKILSTYSMSDGGVATHYLWDFDQLQKVWVKGTSAVSRRELEPSRHDIELIESFAGYDSRFIRKPRFFSNGRINASPDMNLDSLLTPRAQHNIDLLIAAIDRCPVAARIPMKLCLTAASGQMTRMVFAVTGRGKTKGAVAGKTEVGSWVIGYWRPRRHFEVNVWSCFENRVRKLLSALRNQTVVANADAATSIQSVVEGVAKYYIGLRDCRKGLREIPERSASLIITDPPHNDRVPYLELSEFWNSLLGASASFDDEVVVSNAKERGKNTNEYSSAMREFFQESARVLADNGRLIVLFNGRAREAWSAFREAASMKTEPRLRYVGRFPCAYSANSVVQDNRGGAMKFDWALLFSRGKAATALNGLTDIAGWSTSMPENMAGSE